MAVLEFEAKVDDPGEFLAARSFEVLFEMGFDFLLGLEHVLAELGVAFYQLFKLI
jgi:hypothetical protein